MATARRDFYFRNRRWLLLSLAVIAWFFLPAFHLSTGARIARLLAGATAGSNLRLGEHVFYGLAAALLLLGTLWRTWGSAYLGTNVVQDRQLHSERLVANGPYRRTRNPLYFGNMLLACGLAAFLNPVGAVVVVIGMWILVRLFIRDEEAGLQQSQGESFRAYRAAVPRLVPAWRARTPAAGARPRWVQGICGESILWMFALLTAGYAATLDRRWLGKTALWGVIIALPLYLWAKRRSRLTGPGSA
jgi:protein-S-isoprenylcysteine O-methyltransferase Ste14